MHLKNKFDIRLHHVIWMIAIIILGCGFVNPRSIEFVFSDSVYTIRSHVFTGLLALYLVFVGLIYRMRLMSMIPKYFKILHLITNMIIVGLVLLIIGFSHVVSEVDLFSFSRSEKWFYFIVLIFTGAFVFMVQVLFYTLTFLKLLDSKR